MMASGEKLHRSDNKLFSKNRRVLLLLFIYILLSLLLFDPKLFVGGDNAVYIILAESIVGGDGYTDTYLPDAPPHSRYPFGFPLILSLPLLIFSPNVIVLKLCLLLIGLGSVYFMYGIGESLFKEKIYIIMPFYLSIPILVIYNHWILSEIPFLCFSLGAIYFFMKAQANKKILYYISFIFATYSFFLRIAGISLIISMMLLLILKKQYKYFGIFVLIFLAVFIPWQIRNSSIPRGESYIDQFLIKDQYWMESGRIGFSDLLIRVWKNFSYYSFTVLPLVLFPVFKLKILVAVIGFIFILFTIIGFARKIKSIGLIELYFIFSLIILLGWPRIWASERLLLPILWICIIYIYYGLFWLGKRIKLKHFITAVTGIFVVLNLLDIVPRVRNTLINNVAYLKGDKCAGYTAGWRHYFEIIELIKDITSEDKIILARKPELVYFLSRRKSFTFPSSTDHSKIKDAIKRSDYILVDSFVWSKTADYLLPVLWSEKEKYEVIYRTTEPTFYLFKVIKQKSR